MDETRTIGTTNVPEITSDSNVLEIAVQAFPCSQYVLEVWHFTIELLSPCRKDT